MALLTGWTPRERHAVIASYLGWSLDAFDFFVLVFVLSDVAKSFQVPITGVAWALTLTLAFRPLGAFIFGMTTEGVIYADWDPDWFMFFVGAMLLLATVFNGWLRTRASSR